ncbi:unnamed protein product [Trichogramma brassicae]|uniref:Uncharacterized protein n=1 Tax=Trichogramma brassicae TaxID=86971 RepID=A0A6H5IYH7_9HYME|nr:unnamed protein product [Trichogramma brassicae]
MTTTTSVTWSCGVKRGPVTPAIAVTRIYPTLTYTGIPGQSPPRYDYTPSPVGRLHPSTYNFAIDSSHVLDLKGTPWHGADQLRKVSQSENAESKPEVKLYWPVAYGRSEESSVDNRRSSEEVGQSSKSEYSSEEVSKSSKSEYSSEVVSKSAKSEYSEKEVSESLELASSCVAEVNTSVESESHSEEESEEKSKSESSESSSSNELSESSSDSSCSESTDSSFESASQSSKQPGESHENGSNNQSKVNDDRTLEVRQRAQISYDTDKKDEARGVLKKLQKPRTIDDLSDEDAENWMCESTMQCMSWRAVRKKTRTKHAVVVDETEEPTERSRREQVIEELVSDVVYHLQSAIQCLIKEPSDWHRVKRALRNFTSECRCCIASRRRRTTKKADRLGQRDERTREVDEHRIEPLRRSRASLVKDTLYGKQEAPSEVSEPMQACDGDSSSSFGEQKGQGETTNASTSNENRKGRKDAWTEDSSSSSTSDSRDSSDDDNAELDSKTLSHESLDRGKDSSSKVNEDDEGDEEQLKSVLTWTAGARGALGGGSTPSEVRLTDRLPGASINNIYVQNLKSNQQKLQSSRSSTDLNSITLTKSLMNDGQQQQQQQYRQTSSEDPLQGIELSMPLQTFHYRSGQLNLRCRAKIADIYDEWSELQLGTRLREPVPERVHQDAIQYHKYVSAALEGRQQYKSALLERLSTFSSTTSRSCALYIKTTFI